MPAPWSILVLVYRELDARIGFWAPKRTSRRMSDEESAATLEVLERIPSSVADWSSGLATVDPFDVEEVAAPLRSLTRIDGDTYWLSPRDCHRELERLAPRGRYDSVLAVWPSDGALSLCGWGCTIGPSDEANGAGFSSCVSDSWQSYPNRRFPEEGFVHEWLHQVESILRARGAGPDAFPDLHDAGHLTSCAGADVPPHGRTYGEHEKETGTWQPWYRDYMTARVRRPGGDGCFGIGAELWALR